MADEYIKKQAVVRYLKGFSEKELSKSPYGMITSSVLNKAERAVSEMPAADVQPMKYGKWLSKFEGDIYEFSECSECENITSCETPYCAQCGARMDGEQNDNERKAED